MRVRLLAPGDESLLIEAGRLLNDEIVTSERATMLLADESFFIVVALSDTNELMGRIYGHVLKRLTQTDLLLYEVDVDDAHQRKGAARAMIDHLKQHCIDRGYSDMWVLTEADNTAANALYTTTGARLEAFPTAMYVYYPEGKE